jgi:hypothetical protein
MMIGGLGEPEMETFAVEGTMLCRERVSLRGAGEELAGGRGSLM